MPNSLCKNIKKIKHHIITINKSNRSYKKIQFITNKINPKIKH